MEELKSRAILFLQRLENDVMEGLGQNVTPQTIKSAITIVHALYTTKRLPEHSLDFLVLIIFNIESMKEELESEALATISDCLLQVQQYCLQLLLLNIRLLETPYSYKRQVGSVNLKRESDSQYESEYPQDYIDLNS